MVMWLLVCASILLGNTVNAFALHRTTSRTTMRPVVVSSRLSMSMGGLDTPMASLSHLFVSTLQLADTSVTEEEVLSVTGASAVLPDPIFVIVAAGVLLVGIAVLQFSLGDLTKEVRDGACKRIFQGMCRSLQCTPSPKQCCRRGKQE